LLSQAFLDRVRPLLSDDFEAFVAAFDQPRVRGLRRNPAKIGIDQLNALLGVPLEPVPWCPTGYTFPSEVSLGGHPARLSGLYYLQEPSSMAVAEAVQPEPGWSIIDLAAAPGGKATQLSDLVGSGGLVAANEVVGSRLRPLHDNLDLWGARNVVTLSKSLDELGNWGAHFDAAVLDAPCSGEGLFRRNPESIREWSPEIVAGSARRQARLLTEAARLVRPGGVLVYSTCTFAVEENEQRVADFLSELPGWELDSVAMAPGFSAGVRFPSAPTERTVRLWPHRLAGEGQFFGRLRRTGSEPGVSPAAEQSRGRPKRRNARRLGHSGAGRAGAGSTVPEAQVRRVWQEFRTSAVPGLHAADERVLVRGDRVFLLPERSPVLPLEALARPGLPLGRARPGRFEPHPALATALTDTEVAQRVTWQQGASELTAYLRGETVPSGGPDGWVQVCFESWGLGWARRSQGVLKNRFPIHLREQAARWTG
jgi:16S rRNA C967 or C1407 C5-methylase (RsmB/RsmF family)/NOL1/NOP2/fmu family ribosome biogenesis protein